MIKAFEKDSLEDNFIIKTYINNISIKDKIYFKKDNIYYFGNYKEDKIKDIEKKLVKNKKRLINAIEKGVKFLVYGNSIELFNNSFKSNKLNIFTAYNKRKYSKKIKILNSLKQGSDSLNFRYKNLICISNNNIFKKQSISTLLH